MKAILLFLLIVLTSCNYARNTKKEKDIQSIVGTLTGVECSWFEDSVLNRKARMEEQAKSVWLYITMSNPNDVPVYLPVNTLLDSIYCSYVEVHLNNKILYSENHMGAKSQIINGKSQRRIWIKIYDIETGGRDNNFDIKEVIKKIKFKYIKCLSDTIYIKKEIGNIQFIISKDLEFRFLPPEAIYERF